MENQKFQALIYISEIVSNFTKDKVKGSNILWLKVISARVLSKTKILIKKQLFKVQENLNYFSC